MKITMSTGNLPKPPKLIQKEPIPTITPMTAAKTKRLKKWRDRQARPLIPTLTTAYGRTNSSHMTEKALPTMQWAVP